MARTFIGNNAFASYLKILNKNIDNTLCSSDHIESVIERIKERIKDINNRINNITLKSLGGVGEAPKDSNYYARKNGEWSKVKNISISEFPDGFCECDKK